MHQITFGYERELSPVLSASVDYIQMLGRDLHIRTNFNPQMRSGTFRTDPVTRSDAFNVLDRAGLNSGDAFVGDVWVTESVGSSRYNAINFQLEKRLSSNWSGRAVYSLSKSEGDTFALHTTNFAQVGTSRNLADLWGPSPFDRRHNVTLSGQTLLPGGITLSGVLRYMSGQPFHLFNSDYDLNRNGVGPDFLDPGSYADVPVNPGDVPITVDYVGGLNGAYGPDFLQIDTRIGYRARWASPADAGSLLRDLQRHEPCELHQPERGPEVGQLPVAAVTVGRERLPASGADRHALRLLVVCAAERSEAKCCGADSWSGGMGRNAEPARRLGALAGGRRALVKGRASRSALFSRHPLASVS